MRSSVLVIRSEYFGAQKAQKIRKKHRSKHVCYLQALGNHVYGEKLLNIIALMKCEDHHTGKLI